MTEQTLKNWDWNVVQDQFNPTWVGVVVGIIGGGIATISGLLALGWRLGSRDRAIDANAAQTQVESDNEIHNRIYQLRIYVDEQDKANRHEWANILQRELGKTDAIIEKGFDRITSKVEYHERHDDERFAAEGVTTRAAIDDLRCSIDDMRRQVYGIEVRNAERDNKPIPPAPRTV